MLAHSLRDSVHRGTEGMVQSLGQLIHCVCSQEADKEMLMLSWLPLSFLF